MQKALLQCTAGPFYLGLAIAAFFYFANFISFSK